MMKLFIGLGNPGKQYATTRHNAGFIALEDFCKHNNGTDFLFNKKFQAELATGMFEGVQYIALKPMKFMNRSGGPVQAVMDFYDIDPQNCLILHDDIDLPAGALKLKYNGGHGGHNGLRDIFAKVGSKEFRRVKIGVGRPTNPHIPVSDYVLGNFSQDAYEHLLSQTYEIQQKVIQFLKNTGKRG